MVALTEAGLTLALATLLFLYMGRLRTTRRLQKRAFQVSLGLFVAAILSNLGVSLIPGFTSADIILYSKRTQGIFDYLLAISMGAFVMTTIHPAVARVKDLFWNTGRRRPTALTPYTAVFLVGIVGIAIVPAAIEPIAQGGYRFVFPMEFVGLVLLCTLLFLSFWPARILAHIARARTRTTQPRNLLLVLLGVETYAIAEFVFEILLPSLGTDARGIGFTINLAAMGVIAYAIKERTVLDHILVPVPEAFHPTERKFPLDPGSCYLILEEKGDLSFEVFQDSVTHGSHGLCITREMPRKVQARYGLQKTPILWLSRNVESEDTLRPAPPEGISLAIEHFVSSSPRSIVLLDGIEYLIYHNDFRSVLTLLNDLTETIAVHNAVLLVPVSPDALDPREVALLRRGLTLLPEASADALLGEISHMAAAP